MGLVKKIQNKKRSKSIGALEVEGQTVTDPTAKAIALNNFFSNIGKELAKKFETSTDTNKLPSCIYRVTPTINSFALPDVPKIEAACKKLNPIKAAGLDNISSREIKDTAPEFSIGLSTVINKMFLTNTYPDLWKIAKVKSAFKKGSSKVHKNYRPLSLLTIPSKISENIICQQVDTHMKDHKPSSNNQWGFKQSVSTETILLYLTETWKMALDNGSVVGALFIDFEKAFDTIEHQTLGMKLQAVGISGNCYSLLMNYLTDRQQYVDNEGAVSNLCPVEYGVPQGSLLGPRLFSIYVNDMPEASKIGEIHLYADDTTAFVISKTVDEAVLSLNLIAKDIERWCNKNKLTISKDKTEYMIISSRNFIGPTNQVAINGNNIRQVTKTKCLGVTIDSHLSWSDHILNITKSFNSKLAFLKRISFLPQPVMEEIYFKTIIPSVAYGMLVWGTCLESKLSPLEKLHARAAKIVCKLGRETSSDQAILTTGWMKLSYIYKKRIATFMHDCYYKTTDPRLANLFEKDTARSTRNNKLKVIRPNIEVGRLSLRYRGPTVWNFLPNDLKTVESREIFKNALKRHSRHINMISFTKGTTFNHNKEKDFIYF